MEVKTELIIRLLVAVFLAFVVGKILVTLLRGFFSNFWSSPGKNRIDIDQMIKKQVRILKEADTQDETVKSQNGKEEKKYQSLILFVLLPPLFSNIFSSLFSLQGIVFYNYFTTLHNPSYMITVHNKKNAKLNFETVKVFPTFKMDVKFSCKI